MTDQRGSIGRWAAARVNRVRLHTRCLASHARRVYTTFRASPPVWVRGCRIGLNRFLAEWRKRRLNRAVKSLFTITGR